MSNFIKKTKNPATEEWEEAKWLDNYFAPKEYGVQFKDRSVYNPKLIKLETKDDKISDS